MPKKAEKAKKEIIPQAERPRLSYSIAKILCTQSPLHAWHAHRLLGGGVRKETASMSDGKILEALIFGQDSKILIIPHDDWRTQHAKELRSAAILKGDIPILKPDYSVYAESAMKISGQIESQSINLEGEYQKTLLWESEGVECKGVLDLLCHSQSGNEIYDLKIVDDASPRAFQRKFFEYGWDIQAASYIEGCRAPFRFIVCEKEAPYAVSIIEPSGVMLKLGEMRWHRAKMLWKECLASGVWPSYGYARLDPLPWQISAEEGLNSQTQES